MIDIYCFYPFACQTHRNKQEHFIRQLAGMHLQWFAAEDEGRTEAPTETKIRKAREEGKVARSADLPSVFVLLVALIVLGILGLRFFYSMLEMTTFFIRNATELDITTDPMVLWQAAYGYFIDLTLPLLIAVFVAALLGNVVQVGFMFTIKPIIPDFTKIVPHFGRFFKRILFSTEAMYKLFSMFLKIGALAALSYLTIVNNIERFVAFSQMPIMHGITETARIVILMMFQAAFILLLFSIFDYMFQRRQHLEQLKMTRPELKEEQKQSVGDPQVRMRIRQRMREFLMQNMARKVPEADVVVTNPTHYAVAIRYDNYTMEAPMVVAKGQDNLAFHIRNIAQEHNIPLIENKPLARGLYADVEVGDLIPQKYFAAIINVLREVYSMRTGGRV